MMQTDTADKKSVAVLIGTGFHRWVLGAGSSNLLCSWPALLKKVANSLYVAAPDPDPARLALAWETLLLRIPLLDIDPQVRNIATGLVTEGCVPPNVFEDALHIAIAAVHNVDFILTWNFKHTANPNLQERIARYLEQRGAVIPFICSPQELLGEDDGSID